VKVREFQTPFELWDRKRRGADLPDYTTQNPQQQLLSKINKVNAGNQAMKCSDMVEQNIKLIAVNSHKFMDHKLNNYENLEKLRQTQVYENLKIKA